MTSSTQKNDTSRLYIPSKGSHEVRRPWRLRHPRLHPGSGENDPQGDAAVPPAVCAREGTGCIIGWSNAWVCTRGVIPVAIHKHFIHPSRMVRERESVSRYQVFSTIGSGNRAKRRGPGHQECLQACMHICTWCACEPATTTLNLCHEGRKQLWQPWTDRVRGTTSAEHNFCSITIHHLTRQPTKKHLGSRRNALGTARTFRPFPAGRILKTGS